MTLPALGLPLAAAAFLLAGAAAGAAETAWGSRDQQQQLIGDLCGTQIPALGAEGCACLAERSMQALSDAQREYLVMTVIQPPAADDMPMAKSQADLKVIAEFIQTAQGECAAPVDAAAPASDEPAPADTAAPANGETEPTDPTAPASGSTPADAAPTEPDATAQ